MEKLKDIKNKKHDHLLTKILKVSIFALIMLAPMFAVAAKCMYVAFNKNAKDSYYGETINEEQYVNVNYSNLQLLNTYQFTNNTLMQGYTDRTNLTISISDLVVNSNFLQAEYPSWSIDNATRLTFYITNDTYLQLRLYYDNQTGFYYQTTGGNIDISFTLLSKGNSNQEIMNTLSFISVVYNDFSYIDNVFYYSVDQIGNEQIFSWTKQTAIYNAVNTMTSGLGIDPTNNILAVLITYWTLNTIVYVIIDIVLELFVKLTHMI